MSSPTHGAFRRVRLLIFLGLQTRFYFISDTNWKETIQSDPFQSLDFGLKCEPIFCFQMSYYETVSYDQIARLLASHISAVWKKRFSGCRVACAGNLQHGGAVASKEWGDPTMFVGVISDQRWTILHGWDHYIIATFGLRILLLPSARKIKTKKYKFWWLRMVPPNVALLFLYNFLFKFGVIVTGIIFTR